MKYLLLFFLLFFFQIADSKAQNDVAKKADSLYLNKTIEITGKVTKETDSVITL